jgi:methylmalonic acid semialdehyde dehydrogenase
MTTIKQRTSIMMKFYSLIVQHSEELSELIVAENGKNYTEAMADIAKGNETVEWACGMSQIFAGRILEVSRGIECREVRAPLGVVAAIAPFNFPFMVPMWTIPISLMCGNCVILKPSEKVPMTMQRVIDLFIEAGIPSGVFQVVHGAVEVVNALCENSEIAAVSFVGSSKVAEIVSQKCHKLNKRVLALGGAKNHLIALPDCDRGMASRDIVASFAGCCGQRCMAASVLVLVGDCGGLLQSIIETALKLTPGQGQGEIGPLIDGIAKDRVLNYINSAEKDGVKILLDGRSWTSRENGYWVGPTILLHSSKTDAAVSDEIFGPVLSVLQVDTWEEAVSIENSNPYGNAACIYTEMGAHAEWFAKRFKTAMVGVNIGIPVPREPFSFGGLYGTKSKFGDYDITGDGAMEFFTNRKKITSKWTASYSSGQVLSLQNGGASKKSKIEDKANFDGRI